MTVTLTAAQADASFEIVALAGLQNVACASGKSTALEGVSAKPVTDVSIITRYLARSGALDGGSLIEKSEVDHWLSFAVKLSQAKLEDGQDLAYLDEAFTLRTCLVGQAMSHADVAVYAALLRNKTWGWHLRHQHVNNALEGLQHEGLFNVARWFGMCELAFGAAQQACGLAVHVAKATGEAKAKQEDAGEFFNLGKEWQGKVVTRFPPEASGYMHVGHCKAALINTFLAAEYGGKLIFRFDDTNPEKESEEFEKIMLEDMQLLGIKFDKKTHTSDSFDYIQSLATKLVDEGKAYIEDLAPAEMSRLKMAKLPSPNRDRPVPDNQAMWKEMIAGTAKGCTYVMRLKMDPASSNGQLRDPAIYRTKLEPHARTGTKYKVYPLYCFSCPIVDSIEGITHALRTTEYQDQDVQFIEICKLCGIRCPIVDSYSRLDFKYTCLAKRQLRWFIGEGKVRGWDDPRVPTLRGMLKRGLTLQALKAYIRAQGSSRTNTVQTQDKLWSFNKAVIDPIAPRHVALLESGRVPVTIEGVVEAEVEADGHPKNPKVAKKKVWVSPNVWIEAQDATSLEVGKKVTFMDLGNVTITEVDVQCGIVMSAKGTFLTGDTDYKGTVKVTWLANCKGEDSAKVPVLVREHADLLTVDGVSREDGVEGLERDHTKVSEWEHTMVGASSMMGVKRGDIIQIMRRGFFVCESPHVRFTQRKLILNAIPDGKAKPTFIKDDPPLPASADTLAEAKAAFEFARANKEVVAKSTKGDKSKEKEAQAKVKECEKVVAIIEARLDANSGKGAAPAPAKKTAAPAAGGDPVQAARAKVDALKAANGSEEDVHAALDALEKVLPAKAAKAATPAVSSGGDDTAVTQACVDAGDVVRQLKSDGKSIADALEALKAAKEAYKAATGNDYKPAKSAGRGGQNKKKEAKAVPAETPVNPRLTTPEALAITAKIAEAGAVVRKLKQDKQDIAAALEALKALKVEYQQITGEAHGNAGGGKKGKKDGKGKGPKQPKKEGGAKKPDVNKKGETKLGMQSKKEGVLSDWYPEVITKSGLIEYYTPVSGCYILKPPAYAIWEVMKDFFDKKIKAIGVENAYFPMFVSEGQLNKEKDHIADFSPEVAWVTRSGDTELKEPIAIRPTSETVIYPFYAKWIRSHRDLPMRMNQWCNVVRWEFKQPQPFLRTREFLWQEGHTCFADKKEAEAEVMQILDFYGACYEEVLALPVVRGRKTEKEKFAGGDFTTTVEAFIPAAGRCIQGATSHHLGQNFSKMFNIEYEAADGTKGNKVYQNSWGITTRTIGVMVMVHSDNKGLVTPPRAAQIQVVLIPCGVWKESQGKDPRLDKCKELELALKAAGIRAKADLREDKNPGWKYSDWELKGVPVRLEVGPKDIEKKQATAVRRDNGEKTDINEENLAADVAALMEKMQADMLAKATAEYAAHRVECTDWDKFVPLLNQKNVLLVPFCGDKDCEDKIKDESARLSAIEVEDGAPSMGAKSLCFPFEARALTPEDKCICPGCDIKPQAICMFGRSY